MVDYHLHTSLCKHAMGTIEEYVVSALQKGIGEICFSDHIPLADGFDAKHRMKFKELEFYLKQVDRIKGKYTDISVLTGIEADYLEGYESYLDDILNRYPFDLVILSIHFIKKWLPGYWVFDFDFPNKSIKQVYADYFECLLKGINTGFFDIVGHLDLIKQPGKPVLKSNSTDLENVLKAILNKNMSIELNTSGLRKSINELYPSLDIVKLAISKGIPLTLGSDAHSPDQVGFYFTELWNTLSTFPGIKWASYQKRRMTISSTL